MRDLVKLENHNGNYVVSSRVVANGLGKRHDSVLRDIRNLFEDQSPQICGNLETTDLCSLIIPNTYRVSNQKRNYKEFLLTKDGFTLYMFNIQGYLDFKMAYINEFNRMEQELKNKTLPFKAEVPVIIESKPLKIRNTLPTVFEELQSLKRMIDMLSKEIDKDVKAIKNHLGRIEDHKTHISFYASVLKRIV